MCDTVLLTEQVNVNRNVFGDDRNKVKLNPRTCINNTVKLQCLMASSWIMNYSEEYETNKIFLRADDLSDFSFDQVILNVPSEFYDENILYGHRFYLSIFKTEPFSVGLINPTNSDGKRYDEVCPENCSIEKYKTYESILNDLFIDARKKKFYSMSETGEIRIPVSRQVFLNCMWNCNAKEAQKYNNQTIGHLRSYGVDQFINNRFHFYLQELTSFMHPYPKFENSYLGKNNSDFQDLIKSYLGFKELLNRIEHIPSILPADCHWLILKQKFFDNFKFKVPAQYPMEPKSKKTNGREVKEFDPFNIDKLKEKCVNVLQVHIPYINFEDKNYVKDYRVVNNILAGFVNGFLELKEDSILGAYVKSSKKVNPSSIFVYFLIPKGIKKETISQYVDFNAIRSFFEHEGICNYRNEEMALCFDRTEKGRRIPASWKLSKSMEPGNNLIYNWTDDKMTKYPFPYDKKNPLSSTI